MKAYKVRVRDAGPKVGPFFIIGDEIYAAPVDLSDAEEYAGTYNNTVSHNSLYYKSIAPQLGFSQKTEWEMYPRGRVVAKTMSNGTKKFYVFMDKCLFNRPNVKQKIIEEFRLFQGEPVWKTDSHYKCANCGAIVMPDDDDLW